MVVGCIYNECYLQALLGKLSFENKDVILISNFNVDLLYYETHNQSRDFLDKTTHYHTYSDNS